MKQEIRVIAKIDNLDKPTRNGTYYSAECLAKAFEEPVFACANHNHAVLVKLACGDIIGNAQAELNYPIITVDMKLALDEYQQKIIELCGVAPAGFADTEYKASDTATYYNMKNVRLIGWDIVSFPSMNCSMEIVKE